MINDELNARTLCQICGKRWRFLGSHIVKSHKMTTREYKIEYELPFNMSLMDDNVLARKRNSFENTREIALANLNTKYSFKKGHNGRHRTSRYEAEKVLERILSVNASDRSGKCLVCGRVYENIASHLYNKHGLIDANK